MERRRRLRSTGRGLTLNRTAFSFFSCFPHLFFPVISLASRTARLEPSARARRAPTHFLSSFPATTKRLREQLASLRARATGRCLRGLRSSKCIPSSLPGLRSRFAEARGKLHQQRRRGNTLFHHHRRHHLPGTGRRFKRRQMHRR